MKRETVLVERSQTNPVFEQVAPEFPYRSGTSGCAGANIPAGEGGECWRVSVCAWKAFPFMAAIN